MVTRKKFIALFVLCCALIGIGVGAWEVWFHTVPRNVEVFNTIPGIHMARADPLRLRLLFFGAGLLRFKSFDIRNIGAGGQETSGLGGKLSPDHIEIWISRPNISEEGVIPPAPVAPSGPLSPYDDLFGGFSAELRGNTLVIRLFGQSADRALLQQELNQRLVASALVLDAHFYQRRFLPDAALKLIKNRWLLETIVVGEQ